MKVRRLVTNRMFLARVSYEVFDWENFLSRAGNIRKAGACYLLGPWSGFSGAALAMKHWIGEVSRSPVVDPLIHSVQEDRPGAGCSQRPHRQAQVKVSYESLDWRKFLIGAED